MALSNGISLEDTITLTLVNGKNLVCKESKMKVMMNGGKKTSDPYVVATVCGDFASEVRSKTVIKDLNPNWKGERLMVNKKLSDRVEDDPFVRLAVIDADLNSSDDPMGLVTIPLSSLQQGVTVDNWFPVENCEGCNDASGEIRVIVYVGPAKDPDPLPDDVIALIKNAKITKLDAEKAAKAEEKAVAKTEKERAALKEAAAAKEAERKAQKEKDEAEKKEKAAKEAERKAQYEKTVEESKRRKLEQEAKDKEMAEQLKAEKAAHDAKKKEEMAATKANKDLEQQRKKEEAALKKAETDKKKEEAAIRKEGAMAARKKEEAQKKEEKEKKKQAAATAAGTAATAAGDNEAEKARKAEEARIKKEEAARIKMIKDEENKVRKAEAAKLKAIKDAENKVKKEEAARAKAIKDQENKIKKEEAAKAKAIKDAELKEKRQEVQKEKLQEQKSKAELDKIKAQQQKEKAQDQQRKNEVKRANKQAAAAESARRKEERRARAEQRRADRAEHDRHNATRARKREEQYVFDEELGRKVRIINDRSKTEDTCCNHTGFRCCMGIAFFFYFVLYPLIYVILIAIEHKAYGWERFLARSDGHAYWGEDGVEPTPTMMPIRHRGEQPEPAPAPKLAGIYEENEHPLLWLMPLIGVAVGLFANIAPISAGLILMPLFQELDVCRSSEATLALTCAISFINNGVFGFTTWCIRDARFFISRALFLCVPFAWAGYAVGVTNHLTLSDMVLSNKKEEALMHSYLRLTLAILMVSMAFVAFFGACIGGTNRFCCPSSTGGSTPGGKSFCQWIMVLLLSFNTGYFFVANVGAGMGFTSFFALSVFLGVETKRALPTAIVIGGWTSFAPFVLNFFLLEAAPYVRLLMITPGLWFGAILAPWFSKCGGPTSDLVFFGLLALGIGTAVICFTSMALQKGDEDINIDLNPIYDVKAINKAFGDIDDDLVIKSNSPPPKPAPPAPVPKPAADSAAKPGPRMWF